jgi:hypothetical protein
VGTVFRTNEFLGVGWIWKELLERNPCGRLQRTVGMIAQRSQRYGFRHRIALIGVLAIGSAFVGTRVVTRGSDKPSYGGRPSKSLSFAVPKTRVPAAVVAKTSNDLVAPIDMTSVASSAKAFADAIVHGDTNSAFRLLTNVDRNFYGSAEQFAVALEQDAPWLNAEVATTGTSIVATVQRTPQIDEAFGLVTARAVVSLPAKNESGVWHVDWRRRTVSAEPTLRDETAKNDVATWAQTRQACKPDAALEPISGLTGVTGFASALCGTKGKPTVGDVAPLDVLVDPGPFVDAFGAGVMRWGRVVTLRTPIDMRVVVAPVGDRWLVVGLARPEPVVKALSS